MTNSRRNPDKASSASRGKQKKSKQPKQKRTFGQHLRRVLLWVAALGLAGILTGLIAFIVLYQMIDIPDENAEFTDQTTLVYYADGKEQVGRYNRQNRIPVALDDVPQTMQDAVVAAENKSFWTDAGIDPKGILRAAFSNARAGQTVGGGSTITQQYVKILYLNQERSIERKVKEAIVSLKIQRDMSKREVLEGYLNTIYYGRGAYGIQAAAQAYFGVDAEDLTLRQSAVLASVINNPTNLDPANGPDSRADLKERYDYALSRMAADGLISDAEAVEAQKRLPKFRTKKVESTWRGQNGHMLKLVRDELLRLGYSDSEIDGGGLRVTTTFDKTMMEEIQEQVLAQRPEGFSDKDLHIGAATVETGTGELKAFYGGQDYLDSQINWAATGGMAGSTMKAFTVATALENGYSLNDTFQGWSPYVMPGVEVYNAGEGSSDIPGNVSLTTATARSTNTVFVDVSDEMEDGPKKIYDMSRKVGLPGVERNERYPGIPMRSVDLLPEDALITLGKARISPVNMANAYATIANEGRRANVHVVTKVVSSEGETYKAPKRTTRAMSADVAADTSYALQQVVSASGGSGSAARALGRASAGKTGTATAGPTGDTHVSSSWYVGYTPQYSTAVMYVRGDGDDQLDGWLPSYYGGSYPARTWTAIMQRVMDGQEVESFPAPAWVDGDAGSSSGGYTGGTSTWTPAPTPGTGGEVDGEGSGEGDEKEPSKKPTPTKKPTTDPEPPTEPTAEPTPDPTPPPTTDPTTDPTPDPPIEPPAEQQGPRSGLPQRGGAGQDG